MYHSRFLSLAIASLVFVWTLPDAAAQNDEPTLYVAVECMKSKTPDYTSVETDLWQPVHQALVDQGKKNGWALYWVMYGDRTDCDYFVVNSFLGEEQLNDPTSYADVFQSVHPGIDMAEVSARTAASRDLAKTELWAWVDGVPPEDFQYVAVNWMYADDGAEYLDMEREVYKPVHQRLVDMEMRTGWGVYELIMPWGTSMPYNYATADFSNQIGGVPWGAALQATHPGMELSAISQKTEETRDLVINQLWTRVASTTPAAQ